MNSLVHSEVLKYGRKKVQGFFGIILLSSSFISFFFFYFVYFISCCGHLLTHDQPFTVGLAQKGAKVKKLMNKSMSGKRHSENI